jgi:histidyl-tRNA synthetase
LPAQFAASERDEVPFAIILGENELQEGMVTVKEQRWEILDGVKQKVPNTSQGEKVERAKLVESLKRSEAWNRQNV